MADPDYAERIRRQKAAWRAKNKDSIRQMDLKQRERPEVRERRNARVKERRAEDPQYAMQRRLRSRLSMAFKAKKPGTTMALVGCTLPELCAHLEKNFLPGMSWENRSLWHIDHIRPVSTFDLTDPEQALKCFHFSNLQPLWVQENLTKGKRWPMVETEALD